MTSGKPPPKYMEPAMYRPRSLIYPALHTVHSRSSNVAQQQFANGTREKPGENFYPQFHLYPARIRWSPLHAAPRRSQRRLACLSRRTGPPPFRFARVRAYAGLSGINRLNIEPRFNRIDWPDRKYSRKLSLGRLAYRSDYNRDRENYTSGRN